MKKALWIFILSSVMFGVESGENKAQILEPTQQEPTKIYIWEEIQSKDDIPKAKAQIKQLEAQIKALKKPRELKSGGFIGGYMGHNIAAGILGGYTAFFNPYFGLRSYGTLGYGDSELYAGSYYRDIWRTSVNIDLLAEIAFGAKKQYALGLIIGTGYGYLEYYEERHSSSSTYYSSVDEYKKENTRGAMINFGFSFNFAHKHRIELLGRAIMDMRESARGGGNIELGYTYVY